MSVRMRSDRSMILIFKRTLGSVKSLVHRMRDAFEM